MGASSLVPDLLIYAQSLHLNLVSSTKKRWYRLPFRCAVHVSVKDDVCSSNDWFTHLIMLLFSITKLCSLKCPNLNSVLIVGLEVWTTCLLSRFVDGQQVRTTCLLSSNVDGQQISKKHNYFTGTGNIWEPNFAFQGRPNQFRDGMTLVDSTETHWSGPLGDHRNRWPSGTVLKSQRNSSEVDETIGSWPLRHRSSSQSNYGTTMGYHFLETTIWGKCEPSLG